MTAIRPYLLMLPWLLVLPGLSALPGCRVFKQETPRSGKSPLVPLAPDPAQIDLEVLFVKLPDNDEQTAEAVWRGVDESALPAAVRREAARNGFRAGVLGGQWPAELSDLLQVGKQPPADASREVAATQPEPDAPAAGVPVDREPTTTLHRLYLESGETAEIVAGDIRRSISVLFSEAGGLQGRSFSDAQPQFTAEAVQQGDGRVGLTLVPELHHGPFQQRYRGGDGMFRVHSTRDKLVFDKLRIGVSLAPGDLLVLGQSEDLPGSLGHHFFTAAEGGRAERQLLLIRLRPRRHDQRFLPDSTADLQPAGERAAQ